MKKYEYFNISIDKFFYAGSQEHRQIIDSYAAKGYRYAGYIPTEITGHGKIISMDLIFEMDSKVEEAE